MVQVTSGELQARLDSLANGTQGGVAMAWLDAGKVSFFTSGHFDLEDPRPITPDTQFEIASITKVFTALLFAVTERLGKVSRDDPVGQYLLGADDPDTAKLAKITLVLLATHHSGLPREPSSIPAVVDASHYPFAHYTREQLIDALRTDGISAPAGLVFAYSNFGFALLGEALAGAWQSSYTEALNRYVLGPMGLYRTTVAMAGTSETDDLAPGHANGKSVGSRTYDAAAPSLALRSSVRELTKFLNACMAGPDGPINPEIRETLKPLRETENGFIGMGWGIVGDAASPTYCHSAGTYGYRAFLGFNLQQHRGVALLTNTVADVDALGWSLFGLKAPAFSRPIVKNAGDYVGWYPLSPSFAVRVGEQEGSLYFQAAEQAGVWLKPVSGDCFVTLGAPAEVSFQRDASGTVVSTIWRQNGQKYMGFRRDLPSLPIEIVLPRAALYDYAGQYVISSDFTITVLVTDRGLTAQATGQVAAPIFASANDEFFYKVIDARITFRRKSSGEVCELILHQRGRVVVAKKL